MDTEVTMEVVESCIMLKMVYHDPAGSDSVKIHRTSIPFSHEGELVDIALGFVNKDLTDLGAEPLGQIVVDSIRAKFIEERGKRNEGV